MSAPTSEQIEKYAARKRRVRKPPGLPNRVHRALYYARHRDRVLKATADWQRRNPAKVALRNRRYRRRHPDRVALINQRALLKLTNRRPDFLFAWAPNVIAFEDAYNLAAPVLNPFEMLALKEDLLAA